MSSSVSALVSITAMDFRWRAFRLHFGGLDFDKRLLESPSSSLVWVAMLRESHPLIEDTTDAVDDRGTWQ